ncbi:MAG: uracil-DNA glycosylase [Saprospiraceae bacterium]
MSNVKIEPSWKAALSSEFSQPYFQSLATFLRNEKAAGKTVYPPGSLIFNAFNTTPFNKVKILLLGQDPYHNPGQAMGLSFSVPRELAKPASLRNVYKELNTDLGLPVPDHGDLTKWANQGVLLLNAMLTVEKKKPRSHQKIGWQTFTDAVIRKLSNDKEHIVFMLWGGFAKKKAALIDGNKHLVLQAAHPSPLAGTAFLNNKHFSQANEYLTKHGKEAIDWNLMTD